MGYLRWNSILAIITMTFFASFGFFANLNTQLFLILIVGLAIGFVISYVVVWAAVRDKDKFFVHQAEEKIRYHMFFKKAVIPASVIEFIIIFILVSGIFDFSEIITSVLQAVILALLYVVLNGIMLLVTQYLTSNYNYNIYKALVHLATKSPNDIQNLHFLRGLIFYDKHIRRKFGLTINSVENIFNQYSLLEQKDRNTLLTSLLNTEMDSLADFRTLNTKLNFSGNILAKVSYAQRLNEFSSFMIPIIAVLLTLVQLVFNLD